MPNTRELVSIIKQDYAPDWGVPKILELLDRAQRFLMKNDCAQTVWLNEDDPSFPFPIFPTTSGTLSYAMNPSNLVDSDGNPLTPTIGGYNVNIRRIKHIFIVVGSMANSNYDRKFFGEQFSLTGINEYWSQRLYRLSFYKVPGDIRDATGLNQYPRFIFHEDPGSWSDRFYAECFYDPVPLSSLDIPLSLDGDKWEMELIDGVVGYIEDMENGKSERLERFQGKHLRKFMNTMNEHMNERREPQMPIRECF